MSTYTENLDKPVINNHMVVMESWFECAIHLVGDLTNIRKNKTNCVLFSHNKNEHLNNQQQEERLR